MSTASLLSPTRALAQFPAFTLSLFSLLLALLTPAHGQTLAQPRLLNVTATPVTYRGIAATRVVQAIDQEKVNFNTLALVTPADFQDGTIELDLAGSILPGIPEFGNGFLGVAFRIQPETSAYEMVYLRPNNARAPDQLRRNHTTQYVSHPGWSWERTRKETPGLYESYADLETGAWTKLRLVVSGVKAELYLNGATQPCLIINDLKQGVTKGAIGLWVGSGADAYFTNLRVTRAP